MKDGGQRPCSSQREPALVLIADDEAAIADALEEFVTELGYQTLVAGNGKQALDLARLHRPTLLLTDMMMPHLNGAGLIAALREESVARKTPCPAIILMTAVDEQAARTAGADIVVKKPFELDDLEQAIRRLIDGNPT